MDVVLPYRGGGDSFDLRGGLNSDHLIPQVDNIFHHSPLSLQDSLV